MNNRAPQSNIHHRIFDEIESTQTFLRSALKNHDCNNDPSQFHLVTSEFQTGGHGRKNNEWIDFGQNYSLAFSLSLPETLIKESSIPISFLPLVIGESIVQFFQNFHSQSSEQLFLKWPNDIFIVPSPIHQKPVEQKVGGIICHNENSQIIVGIGLNLLSPNASQRPHPQFPHGFIFHSDDACKTFVTRVQNSSLVTDECRALAVRHFLPRVYFHFLINFLNENFQKIKDGIQKSMLFVDVDVTLEEDQKIIAGKFLGVGPWGECLLEINGEVKSFTNGTLRKLK